MVPRAGLEPAQDIEAFRLISMTYDCQEGFVCTMCVPLAYFTPILQLNKISFFNYLNYLVFARQK